MSDEAKQVATLKVWRGSARDTGQWQTYEAPSSPANRCSMACAGCASTRPVAGGALLLHQRSLQECMISSTATRSCRTARLEPRAMTLTPLPNKKLIRDLVTEIAPPSERFGK